jgi:hypothetical protein
MREKRMTDVVCLHCKRMLRKKIRWFPFGQKMYLCLAFCPEHGYMRAKIRVKKSENDLPYGVKTIKEASEEDIALLNQKKEDARRRKKTRGRPAER